jgi:hypothetical protein
MRIIAGKLLGICAGLLLCTAVGAATLSGPLLWTPINEDANFFELSFSSPGDFYIFDAGAVPSLANALALDPLVDTVGFSRATGSWSAFNDNGLIALGNTNDFIVAELFNDIFTRETVVNSIGNDGNIWDLTFGAGTGSILRAIDVVPAPVPLPPAVFLFGSAAAALGALGRRRRSRRSNALG